MTFQLLPSILSANPLDLQGDLAALSAASIEGIHIDIMDGHFVPNLTFGPHLVKVLKTSTSFWLDTHLMIEPLEPLLDAFLAAGSHHITIHVEAATDIAQTLQRIRDSGVTAGISLKPATPAQAVIPYLPYVDGILVMTVEPGFGGQGFMMSQLEKISTLAGAIQASGRNIWLEVDGGITETTAPLCQKQGATAFVVGTAGFQGGRDHIQSNINRLKAACRAGSNQ